MDSPVQIPFKSFINLDPNDKTALYLQIVFGFINSIQLGHFPEGTKLPGTRILCKVFNVNRNTLIRAFHDLELQGWIKILPNQGTFILSNQTHKHKAESKISSNQNANTKNRGFSFSHSTVLENPLEESDLPYQFNDGLPDIRLLQTDVLARLYLSKLKNKTKFKSWEQIKAQSHADIRNNFSNFLNLTRGLKISSSSLLTTSSHEISLYLVAKSLIKFGDKVVVASPSYYKSNMTLSDCGAQIVSIPIEKDGISIKHLKSVCKAHHIKALYLTSNYHYPTTIALSAKKRMEVLELANEFEFVIIEDDYDFDLHYDNNPVLPLAAFDIFKRVIYIGSFGRSLPSGFGFGFISAIPEFISELEKHKNILEPEVDVIKEQALNDWIQEGEVHRLFKKNRKVYGARRDEFIALLNKKLKGRIKFQVPARGLAVWIEWLEQFSLIKFRDECASQGLFLPKTILHQNKNFTATRLGFGHFNVAEMEIVVEILQKSLDKILS